MRDIRVAAVVFQAHVGKAAENLSRMEPLIERARQEKAEIICFPEMGVTGYSTRKRMTGLAERVPGAISEQLARMAEQAEITILAGLAERNENGGMHASHLVAAPDGTVAVYRKLYLAPPEQPLFTPADEVPVFDACGVRFGIQLCYDAHFPELATRMAEKGAELIFMPHASPRGTPDDKYRSWLRHLPARAYDNSLFVVVCNQTGDNGAGLAFPGVGLVIDPSGHVINKDLSGAEGILITDLKAKDLARVRDHRMRYFFPNRRPGLYAGPDDSKKDDLKTGLSKIGQTQP